MDWVTKLFIGLVILSVVVAVLAFITEYRSS
jgi:hypothetical protein